jgi:hypothetical protein
MLTCVGDLIGKEGLRSALNNLECRSMPKSAPRLAIAITLGLLLISGLYLIAVRGPALLLDLSALVGMICF